MPPPASPSSAALMSRRALLLLLLLSIAARTTLASPVSSPEIASKSAKTSGGFSQSQQSPQQQQQQQQQQKSSGQEAHLNSLTAYATNFDSISPAHQPHFKPSYKLPDMETNFTPLQSSGGASGLSAGSPVLMQYLPQTLNEGGIQYLQLIPTRPLIVPIGPSYQLAGGSPPLGPPQTLGPAFHPPMAPGGNALGEYGSRATLLAGNGPVPAPAPATLVELPSNLPYGLPTYANSLQPYRSSYRINREAKEKQLPVSGSLISLNLQEYMPGPHDSPHPSYIRGRP